MTSSWVAQVIQLLLTWEALTLIGVHHSEIQGRIADAGKYRMIAPVPGSTRQVSNIRPTLVGNIIVDHSHVVGAAPLGAAPTTSSLSI